MLHVNKRCNSTLHSALDIVIWHIKSMILNQIIKNISFKSAFLKKYYNYKTKKKYIHFQMRNARLYTSNFRRHTHVSLIMMWLLKSPMKL